MTKPSPLTYRELIAPNRGYGPRVLTPEDIPIHPLVYNSDFAYTPEFLRRVLERMSESMREDDRIIRETLKTRVGFVVGDDYVLVPAHEREIEFPPGKKRVVQRHEEKLDFSFVCYSPEPDSKTTGVSIRSSNIDIAPHLARDIQFSKSKTEKHPMSRKRLEEYAYGRNWDSEFQIHSWYIHNLGDTTSPAIHFFRNFAILFNNLGLEQI